MRRGTLDKIASVTLRLHLKPQVILSPDIPAEAGTVVACRVKNAKPIYNTLEDVHGRERVLHPGDIIAGALGHRDALHGYSGKVPDVVAVGDELHLLNKGGVIGCGAVATRGVGEPFRLEVLGSVLTFPGLDRREGRPANIQHGALPAPESDAGPDRSWPTVVALVGTCMNSGKTTAAASLITQLHQQGKRVAAGKLTGVSLRHDILEMADCGAEPVALFTDFGVVTTSASNAVKSSRALLHHLADSPVEPPDVIVLEFGDGLLGTYGVQELLEDEVIRSALSHTILCAQDPVGAYGGVLLLEERFGISTDCISGPVTDSVAGRTFCHERLHKPTWNALLQPAELPHLTPRAPQPARSKALEAIS